MKIVAPSATSASASAALAARLSMGIATPSGSDPARHSQPRPSRPSTYCADFPFPINPGGGRKLDNLAPLLGFLGNQRAEFVGRAGNQHATEIVKPRLDPGLRQHRIDL